MFELPTAASRGFAINEKLHAVDLAFRPDHKFVFIDEADLTSVAIFGGIPNQG